MRAKLALTLLSGMIPGIAMATNGYFLPGFGIKAQGNGGASIALQQDALSVAANPANATQTGMRGDLGMTLFNPERWSATGDATGVPPDPTGGAGGFPFNQASQSGNRLYILPDMAFTMPLSDRLSVGFAVVGNGGMNTTYKENIFGFAGGASGHILSGPAAHGGRNDGVGVDFMQLIAPITVAYKVTPEQSIGASLNLATQRFKANGLGRFVQFGISSDPAHLTNQGYDYSYGAGIRVGWLGKFLEDKLALGATWSSKTNMSKFEKYKGLFAEGGDFDIPENYGIGIALKPTKQLTTTLDITRIKYTGIASVSNAGPGTDGGSGVDQNTILNFAVANGACFDPHCLGEDNGMGFGWKDMTVYKLGLIYNVNDDWTVRAGFNYGKNPISHDQAVFSALAPAVVEKHYSLGFTYKLKTELPMELSGFYMYVPNVEVRENAQAVVDQVAYKMHQHVLGVGIGLVYE